MKVSDGCSHCYAETQSKRNPGVLGIWGPAPKGRRVVGVDAYWDEPRAWDRAAARAGERRRVFAYSLADVFEEFDGAVVDVLGRTIPAGTSDLTLDHLRCRLFRLILDTSNLDWMLLTKRPQNILPMLRRMLLMFEAEGDSAAREIGALRAWIDPPDRPVVGRLSVPPRNVWLGTSVENQEAADERIWRLREVPAVCRFLSVEPLLGPTRLNLAVHAAIPKHEEHWPTERVDGWWVIGGFESGMNARPGNPQWARMIRDECLESNVPFHWKQNGEWVSVSEVEGPGIHHSFPDGRTVRRVGKKKAGRLLDGRTWDEVPDPLKNRRVYVES